MAEVQLEAVVTDKQIVPSSDAEVQLEAVITDEQIVPSSDAEVQVETVVTDEQIVPSLDAPSRQEYLENHLPLHKAALKGDWRAAKEIIRRDHTMPKARITECGETALHIAAASRHVFFVANLVKCMDRDDLGIQNDIGVTALCFAAATGIREIAEVMVEKNENLPEIRSNEDVTPLYMAALQGHSEMADYLYSRSNMSSRTTKDQVTILNTCISSGLCGLALKLFNECEGLATARDKNDETPLQVLARAPSAFVGRSQQALWRRTIFSLLPGVKLAHKETKAHELLSGVLEQENSEISDTSRLLFVAAKLGNVEFLVKLLSSYPDFIWKVNDHRQSIFHIAVLRRDENIFNLIYEVGFRDLIATYKDGDENILHLAAILPPKSQLKAVPGPALQMQRELLWYKAVEKIVHPSYREMKNSKGQTPHDLFTKQHKGLMKEGEKWMRDTARSCMLVATLITTVVFTTAFTVPGGYDKEGAPSLQHEKFFMVFIISEAIAMLSSSTSILMFLSILTSRYAEKDFLRSLPFQLMIGVTTLFVSVAAMMVAFCTTFLLPSKHGLAWVLILFVLFACVPMMFVSLTYSLLVDVIRSTCGSCFMFRSHKRLFG